ncbi:MAG: GTPase ObgE [Dethiobacteria bacterium]
MFVDRVQIFARGGRGGNGVASFLREKYKPRGGPDGGDGGDGGNVILVATAQKNTLLHLSYRPHLRAGNGAHGQGDNRHGKEGESLMVEVPVGTIIKDEKGLQLVDLDREGLKVVVARGGKGGRGNARFTSSRRRAPDFAEKGQPGEERTLLLELKLLADVGLVGFPNAGKSTFLARISAARPKVADYPFTTLTPNLGVVNLGEERSFVVADLPGIIKGAHQGVGLGLQFLKHIERTKVLLFFIDMGGTEGRDPGQDYLDLRHELEQYQKQLGDRPSLIAANKMDLTEAPKNLEKFKSRFPQEQIFPISAATGEGIPLLLYELFRLLQEKVAPVEKEAVGDSELIYLPPLQERKLNIYKKGSVFVVSGDEVENAVHIADLDSKEGLRRFQNKIEQIGVEKRLLEMGIKEGDTVRILDIEFTYST